MNRRNDPGLGQWLTTAIIFFLGILLIYFLVQYSNIRAFMPTGIEVAGIPVGGLDSEGVRARLSERYLTAPITIIHGEERIELSPERDADFRLDFDRMLSDAENRRDNQDYWSGFWSFLWGRSGNVDPVDLRATHDRDALRLSLEQIRTVYDQPAQPPQPVPATLSFLYGETGRRTNIVESLANVENALYRPTNREATLVVEAVEPPRPNINLLGSLIVNHLQSFNGTYSVFILDLENGDEFSINSGLPMSGMSLLKLPIAVEAMRNLDQEPNSRYQTLISDTLLGSGNTSANELLTFIAGEDVAGEGDAYFGVDRVTETMVELGLQNTFMVTPYDQEPRRNKETIETPANTAPDIKTLPDPTMQSTAADLASLFNMLYDCAMTGGGTFLAVYPESITQSECLFLLEKLAENKIGSLLEEGVPPGTIISHKHGWVSDTHGDAGVVFSPNGDYIVVILMYETDWLEWSESSPLMADISRATFNYFNFDTPWLSKQGIQGQ
ncbi:MAG: beta-lactamase class A [Cellvibrionaceae bacterium]|jgi:beta-lactamase class A